MFKGEPPPRKELRITLNKKMCGHTYQSESLLISDKGGIQNVVVSLLRIPKGLPVKADDKPTQIDQQKCIFTPHMLLVLAGVEFEALNSDPVLHNFYVIVLTDTDGQFRSKNVPEGSYRIKAWHEELGKHPVQEVVVATNQDVKVNFEFSQPSEATR